MRAAAILGLGTSPSDLQPFQREPTAEWVMGLPGGANEADAVVLFGGDGTVHRHLGALVRLGLPVLVVPAGSGNDFARSLGLLKLRDSLAAWRAFSTGRGRTRCVDLGQVMPLTSNAAPRYFACVAGVGLDADIARRANQMPRWLRRSGGYALSLPPALLVFRPFPMKVWAGEGDSRSDEPLQTSPTPEPSTNAIDARAGIDLRNNQPTILAAFANGPFYGGGMKIAPRAQLDDGLLDVCIVHAINKLALFSLFPTVYFGRHLGIKEVEYFQAARGVIETELPLDVFADGESVCKTPAEFRVARGALRVIVQ
jgi:diacylglycerol kinase (ATP)